MSVLDNIMAGRNLHMHASFLEVALQLPRARARRLENRAAVEEIIEFPEIEHIRKTPVARLPYGCRSASSSAVRSPPNRPSCCSMSRWPA
jgi:branched-chain amino acid transport system ATP-binding protein